MSSVRNHVRNRRKATGLPPGSLNYVGADPPRPSSVEMIVYNAEEAVVSRPASLAECACFQDSGHVTWITIDGLHDQALMTQAGEIFGIHPLVLEDIVHTTQRPKLDEMDNSIFLTIKMLSYDEQDRQLRSEQASFILGKSYLLSFQEKPGGDVFSEVRARILNHKGRIGKMGPDYLLYALMDAILDNYFVVLERMGEDIADMEERLITGPTRGEITDIHALRREALFLRKFVWPVREVLARLEKHGSDLVEDATVPYLRDLYDHTIQVMDTIETFRDMLSGMLDLYLSTISLRLNEIMKVLTMFSALFIPLTFLAGLYGMNFKYMPELEWHYGYFGLLGVMASVGTGMLFFFRRKGWIGKKTRSQPN